MNGEIAESYVHGCGNVNISLSKSYTSLSGNILHSENILQSLL